jgi:hypothetical protein
MYNPQYNPITDDLYLYDVSNTGYPIGLNPNSQLYGASAYLKTTSVLYRRFEIIGETHSPGLTLSYYPNYYNADIPKAQWISENILSGTVHYMVYPCVNQPGKVAFDYPGATANYGFAFWNNNFSGICFYTQFKPIFNYSEYNNSLGSTLSFSPCSGFSGPTAGTIIYRHFESDHGLIKITNNANPATRSEPFLQSISPLALADQEDKSNNFVNLLVPRTDTTQPRRIKIPVDDVYIVGGNDTIAKLSYIEMELGENGNVITPYFENFITLWVGDSSSPYLYKKGNKLYSVGHITSGSGSGSLHNGTVYPVMKFLQNQTNINLNYYYSNTTEKKVATTAYFTELQNRLQALSTKLQNLLN